MLSCVSGREDSLHFDGICRADFSGNPSLTSKGYRSRGFVELRVSATQASSTLTEFISTSENVSAAPPVYIERLHRMRASIDFWITNDPVAPLLSTVQSANQQHSLLRSNPLLCGLFQFNIYRFLQREGIELSL